MDIYNLDVLDIPTNVPVARLDEDDQVYRTAREKYEAIIETIDEARGRGQPVLVGTTSIEKSELLAEMLKAKGVPHNVLNARYHEQEAAIVAQAGVPGAVTIATNMAGRGTDIKLGGNLEMRVAIELADVPQGPGARPAHRGHQGRDRGQQAEGAGGRRPVRHRHRAPREPPHRQPAARPFRPPGRPRPLAVLSLARRRPDAHLRLRAPELHAEDAAASRRARPSSIRGSTRRWRRRSRRSRRATSTSARTSSSSTT